MLVHRSNLPCLIVLAAALCAMSLLPQRARAAIEPYQAETITPYQAPTVTPHQAAPVPVHQGTTPEVVTAQRTELHQAGFLRYQMPAGWTRHESDGTIIYLAPNSAVGMLCVVAFLPEEKITGSLRDWFLTATRGRLGEGVTLLLGATPVEERTCTGALRISATQITVNKAQQRLYAYHAGLQLGTRGRQVSFLTSSPELFMQQLPTFTTILSTLTTAEAPAAPTVEEVLKQVLPGQPAPPQSAQPTPTTPTPAPPAPVTPPSPPAQARLAVPTGNAVEPLTNGLLFTMSAEEVIKKFGKPASDDRAWGGSIGFAGFSIMYNAKETEIWHFTLTSGARLNSGIGMGSTRAEVEAVFGTRNPVTYDQYALTFRYDDADRVREIKIDPVDTFVPYRKIPLKEAAAPTPTAVKPADFIGTWHGTTVVSQIVVHPDGTYSYNGKAKQGTYTITGSEIVFTGPLQAWNNGRGALKDGALQFYWKNASGTVNYFAFVKGK